MDWYLKPVMGRLSRSKHMPWGMSLLPMRVMVATSRRASHKAGSTRRLPTDPGRDPGAVRRRYLRERKPDLVERLLFVEQAYIESQQQLAQLQFALVEPLSDQKQR
jgi:hypothetical protein